MSRKLSDFDRYAIRPSFGIPYLRQYLEETRPQADNVRLADVSKRMGVKSNYSTKYKTRLFYRGVIGDRGGGYLGSDLPGFREYLESRRAAEMPHLGETCRRLLS